MSESRCELSQLVNWYREYLDHGKSAAFVSCVATRYSNATLIRLARSKDFESRRAAVLALGMLGDRSAIEVVGKSLRDEDRCVRLVAEIAFADLCRREFGDRPRRLLDCARRHIDGDRYQAADVLLASLTAEWPEFGEAWYLQAIVRFCQDEYVQAIGLARRAATLNPNHFSAHALEAKAWLELGKPSRALAAFRRSFVINPSQAGVQGYIDVLSRQVRASGNN